MELDTHSSDAEVYYALRKLLRSNKAESHLVCDDLVLTDDNACGLLKAASVVRVVDGPPPADGCATPPPRGARASVPAATKPRWLPSQHKAARARPAAARHSAPAVTAASTGIVARGMGSADVDSLAASDLSDWVKSYKSEVKGFASTSVNAALRYEEVLAATAGLGAPNAARTRVACQLLDGVVGKFGRYEPIARQLLDDVFASVFVDPEVPEAEPYFLRYGHTMQELRELRVRYDLIAKSHGEHEAASEKRWAYIKRTMKKLFKGQDITAFRQWRKHVRQAVESRAMVTKLITKWRRQDAEKRRQDAWTQWRNAVSLFAQERREGALEKLTLHHENLKRTLTEVETERDSALNEVKKKALEIEKLRGELMDARRDATAAALETEKAQKTAKAFRTMAKGYRKAMSESAKARSKTLKTIAQLGTSVDVGQMHHPGELDVHGLAPVDKLLRWINCHTSSQVDNLSSDLADGAVVHELMRTINPENVSELSDPEEAAAAAVAATATRAFGFPAGCLEPSDSGDPAMNLALLAYMMSFSHGLTLVSPGHVVDACDDLKEAASFLDKRGIDEELGEDGQVDTEVLNNLERVMKKADAAVRDLHSEREREGGKYDAYARDVMTFTLGALVQKTKGLPVTPPIESAVAVENDDRVAASP